jgi:hypothetical protein
MQNEALDHLVRSGSIQSYSYENISEDNEADVASEFRNTERLVLHFNNHISLKIDTICSGCSEDTSMIFDVLDNVQRQA